MKPRQGTKPLAGQSGLDFAFVDTGAWRAPVEFPQLRGRAKKIALDIETDGNEVHGNTKPTGYAIYTDTGFKGYFPVRHPGGGNLDENAVLRFLNGEIQDMEVIACEGKFDFPVTKKAGVDLEKNRCRPREIQFQAALLDDKRKSYSLDSLAKWRLGRGKTDPGTRQIGQLPASKAGPYAENDVEITYLTHESMDVDIDARGLRRVYDLECDIIWAVLAMEERGVPLDMDLLEQWDAEIQTRMQRLILDIYDMTFLRVNPNSPKDMEKLFRSLDIEHNYTDTDQGSFTDEFLKSIPHPAVRKARLYRSLYSLWTKFVRKALVEGKKFGGLFHYKLHQLKLDREGEAGIFGAVSGRFSSSKHNIQQIYAPKKQIKKFGNSDYIIRQAYIPAPGRDWFKADGDQIEFRGFAHYSKSPRLLQAYKDDPKVDFHEIVMKMIQVIRDIDRDDAKTVNFAKLYGSGRDKNARTLRLSREEADEVFEAYDKAFPEAGKLFRQAMNLAKERGWVKTILGRIANFEDRERLHSALNRVIQGTCADIMKLKIKQMYALEKDIDFLMRITVHDELGGDIAREEKSKKMFHEAMHVQNLELRVPITWDVKYGPNWAMMPKAA